MQEATITVFTITYNCKRYIHRCYQSILNQSYEDWIWLVIDDGSTDGTHDAIKAIHDSRIIYHKIEDNVGRGKARNFGLARVETKWLTVLDMDDIMLHNRLNRFHEAILNNYDGLISSTLLVDEGLNIKGLRHVIYNKYFNLFTHATLCIKTEILKNISYSDTRYAEDQRVILLVSKLDNIFYCNEPLYVYQEDASINIRGAYLSNYNAISILYCLFFRNKEINFELKYIFYFAKFIINSGILFLLSKSIHGAKIYKLLIKRRKKNFYFDQKIFSELKKYVQ